MKILKDGADRLRLRLVTGFVGGLISFTTLMLPSPTAAQLPGPYKDDEAKGPDIALRVATIGYTLVVANVSLCSQQVLASGLVLHDLAGYDSQMRDVVAGQLGLGNGFGIRAVVSGSPAQRAGLQAGDELVALGHTDLRAFRLDLFEPRASFSRTEAFTTELSSNTANRSIELGVLRNGTTRTVAIERQLACDVGFTVEHARSSEAWTDGHYVAVTDTLAHLLDNDELAFAIAHEIAHVVLGHPHRPRRPFAGIGLGSGRIREEEAAADRLGVHLAAAAGYSPEGAARMFTALTRSGGMTVSLTHPSTKKRIAAVEYEAVVIRSKR